ncbi:MAG: hypothetical protein ACPGLV_12215 [Bacteroidia bacterium]
MKIIYPLTIVILCFLISCGETENKANSLDSTDQTKHNPKEVDVHVEKLIIDTITEFSSAKHIGYIDSYDTLARLVFEKSSEMEFNDAPPIQKRKLPPLNSTESHLYFTTAKEVIKLEKYNAEKGALLTDFSSNKGWYVFTSHSSTEGLGFGWLFIVDSLTSLKYGIVSITDWSVKTPSLSADGNYLVYYDNYTYQHKNCFIGVIKVDESERENKNKYLVPYKSYPSNNWAIEELRWIDSANFVIKGYEERYKNGEWQKQYTYVKSNIL